MGLKSASIKPLPIALTTTARHNPKNGSKTCGKTPIPNNPAAAHRWAASVQRRSPMRSTHVTAKKSIRSCVPKLSKIKVLRALNEK